MRYFLFLVVFLVGCHSQVARLSSFTATGNALQQSRAFVASAEEGNLALKRHVDTVGAAIIPLVSKAHQEATKQIDVGSVSLDQATKQAQDFQNQAKKAQEKYNQVYHSVGYQTELVCIRFVVVLCILVGIHLLAVILSWLLPPGPALICATIGKIVNPLGWGTWLLGKIQARKLK